MSNQIKKINVAKRAFEYVGVFGVFAMANMVLLANLIITGS